MTSSCPPRRRVQKSAVNIALVVRGVPVNQSATPTELIATFKRAPKSCEGRKTQELVCKEAGYLRDKPQGLNATQPTARHPQLADPASLPIVIAATDPYAQFATMHRSCVVGGAVAMAVRCLDRRAFTELHIVFAPGRTGDPLFGDHHEYRAVLSLH